MHKYIFVTSGFSIKTLFADKVDKNNVVIEDHTHLRESLLRRFAVTEMIDRRTPVLVPVNHSVDSEESEEEDEVD